MGPDEAAAAEAAAPPPKSGVKPPCGLPRPRRNVAAAIKAALATCEAALLKDAGMGIDTGLSGCTGCVAVICGSDVTIANVGDSRAVLLRRTAAATGEVLAAAAAGATAAMPVPLPPSPPPRLHPFALSVDHKPTMASETRRILLCGGRVHAIRYEDGGEGPVRVWLRNEDIPGLAMARSLCDAVGKRAGVSSAPDFYHYTLTPADAFLLLASDGLWEFTPPADAAGVVAAAAQQAAALAAAEPEGAGARSGLHLELALEALAQVAAARWEEREGVVDDTSIILAELGPAAPTGSAAAISGTSS